MVFKLGGSASETKKRISRVPSTLSSEDIRPTAVAYRDTAEKYIKSEPGLTATEKTTYKAQAAETIAGAATGARQRAASTARKYGARGQMEQDFKDRIRQDEFKQQREANVQLSMAEHTLREDDITKRMAAAAGFVWPAENARGAGQISEISTRSKSLTGEAAWGK